MSQKPRIRIVNTSGMGSNTQVFTENGTEISNAIQEITLHLGVGQMNTAEVKAILVGAEIDAVITDLQTKVLPPPQPKVQWRFRMNANGSWALHKLTPLPTYGVKEEQWCHGWASGDAVALEIVGDAE